MSVELISVLVAVLAIGATLAGVILTSNRGLRKDMREDMKQGESRLREDMKQGESRLREGMGKLESRLRDDTSRLRDDIKQLGERVARVEHSQAKLEGLLEGLREAITGGSRPARVEQSAAQGRTNVNNLKLEAAGCGACRFVAPTPSEL